MHKYLHQPHRPDCDCSVCWSKRELAKPDPSQFTQCTQCRRATVTTVNGQLIATPASYCAKHKPSQRPPKYWHVVQDTGKPTPYVPRWDLFESEN